MLEMMMMMMVARRVARRVDTLTLPVERREERRDLPAPAVHLMMRNVKKSVSAMALSMEEVMAHPMEEVAVAMDMEVADHAMEVAVSHHTPLHPLISHLLTPHHLLEARRE